MNLKMLSAKAAIKALPDLLLSAPTNAPVPLAAVCGPSPSISSAMRAAGPATRPALALGEILGGSLDVPRAGFRLLRRGYPADPFIAREGRDVLPGGERPRRREEGGLEIRRQLMHDAARDGLSAHGFKLATSGNQTGGRYTLKGSRCAHSAPILLKEMMLS